ncbi:MAG: long-chain-fatty-acid--CoA ligase [Anaerolineae bacterium]
MYLTQPLHRAMQLRPDHTATIYRDRRQTWKQLGERVARLAGGLRALDVREGDRVAMLSLNSDRYLEYYFAVWWAGAVVVPMNIRWSVPEHVYSLNDSGAEIIVVDDMFKEAASAIQSQAAMVRHVIYAGDGATPEGMLNYESLIRATSPIEDAFRNNEDLSGIFYTGGTTGFPKGVMLTHSSMWADAMSTAHETEVYSDSCYLHAAPMFHLADGAGGFAATIAGATHAMIPAFNPELVLNAIAQYGITHVVLVPTMIKLILEHPAMAASDVSSLKRLLYGASPIPETTLRDAIQKLPHCGLVQAYGQTELSPVASILGPEYHVLDGPLSTKLRSAGRATYVAEVKIVDPTGEEVPRGEVGEVAVRGPLTMQGYWNKPAETAKALVDGWVHTGDAAYMDDEGFIYIVDRIKDMIISGGENVYSVEVENALMKHMAVRDCVVIGVPDDTWGERVHAIVIPKDGAVLSEQDLTQHCAALIATYKVPRSVEFRTEPFPVSGAGKVLKRELRKPYWEHETRQVH